jgi:PAS domain S-box-containing protein
MDLSRDISGLFVALDLAVLQQQVDGSFLAIAPFPDWFLKFRSTGSDEAPFRIEEIFLFLEPFLIEARRVWEAEASGRIQSGPWTEPDSNGEELALIATALLCAGQRILLIERLTGEFEERQRLLQKAREGSLTIERLERVGEALRLGEAEARSLLKSVPDVMFRLRRDGTYLDFEKPRQAELNAPHLGTVRRLQEVLPEAVAQQLMEYVVRALDGGNTQVFEYQLEVNEEPRDLEARVAICGKDEVLVIVRDITERKRAEIELSERLERLKSSRDDLLLILNQLRLGTALTDAEGGCIFLSQTAQQMFGIREEDLLGKTWGDSKLFGAAQLERLNDMSQRPQAERSRVPVDWQRHDGRQYWTEVDLQDDPSNPRRRIFFFYDVSEIYDLRRLLDEKAQFENLVGKSKPIRQVYRLIRDLAAVDSTVLIEGETGTGKELVAKGIYARSHRADRPFIAVNCAGLTEALVESQLFGHKRGSFTGAVADSRGLFEAADGGVLFLDEIGDIPLRVQTSLLRVLQEREITRVGETKPRRVNVRVLAATHRNLSVEVDRGSFRADLLYRVRVARIPIPPLRERLEDIPLLVSRFLGDFRAVTGKPVQEVSTKTLARLMEYSWPGNVRELKSAIEFAVIHCRGSVIRLEDLPPELKEPGPVVGGSLLQSLDFAQLDEKERLLTALKRTGGNRTLAARMLGIGRATLYRRMSTFNLPEE